MASDIDASYTRVIFDRTAEGRRSGGQDRPMPEVRREGEALCRVGRSTMGQLVVTDCKKRQDTGYMWGVRMTMMYIRRKREIVEKGEVKRHPTRELSGMKLCPFSLELVRRLCYADT